MITGATLSDCQTYRYQLWRIWDKDKPRVCFVGLNPSTADAMTDDPTIRRCIGFAKSWGLGGIYMVNLFAFRAARPADMFVETRIPIVGPDNDKNILDVTRCPFTRLVVAAWGTNGSYWERDQRVRKLIGRPMVHLGLTKDGYPRHPLYLKKDTKLEPWD